MLSLAIAVAAFSEVSFDAMLSRRQLSWVRLFFFDSESNANSLFVHFKYDLTLTEIRIGIVRNRDRCLGTALVRARMLIVG